MKKRTKQVLIGYIAASLIIWLGCGCYYGYRMLHYHNLESAGNLPSTDSVYGNLNSAIMKDLVSDGDGLRQDSDGSYYYYGKVANNYVYYSGLTWRIMGVDEDGFVKLISQDNLFANIYSDSESNEFYSSRIYKYLSKNSSSSQNITNLLDSPSTYLYYNNYCQGKITDENDTTCTLTTARDYVGTISVSDYVKAGGISSYLNTSSAFWTSNSVSGTTDSVFYITSNGVVGTFRMKEQDKTIYSVRATIVLKPYLDIVSGNGNFATPYTINSNDAEVSELKDANLGTYVTYSDKMWRVISIGSNSIKLMSADVVKNSTVTAISSKENSNGVFESGYINPTYDPATGIGATVSAYLKELDTDYLVNATFNNGRYSVVTSYAATNTTYTSTIGMPIIENFLVTSRTSSGVAYWTGNYSDSNLQFVNYVTAGGAISQDYIEKEHAIRPVVAVKTSVVITGGNGSYNNPYTISLGE